MGLNEFMAAQLGKPSGWFGSLVMSRILNLVNDRIGAETIALLEVRPEHNVLEIGFGGGAALKRLAKQVRTGVITGVDISPEMVKDAERRFRTNIAAGRLRVQVADAVHLPFGESTFDRVFTINTIYFWPDALPGLGEMRRVLKAGGRAAVSIRSSEKLKTKAVSKHFVRLFSAEELAGVMREAGFSEIKVDHRDRAKLYDQVIVVGCR